MDNDGDRHARRAPSRVPYPERRAPSAAVRWAALLLAGLLLAGSTLAAGEPPASAADDPLAALVREVRRTPERHTYSRLALLVAREIYPDLNEPRQAAFEKELDRLAASLRVRLDAAPDGRSKVQATNALLYQELGLKRSPEELPEKETPDRYFPHAVLAGKQGVCLGLAVLYLALCERTGLPVVPVHAPQHLYIRYDDGREQLNLEPTDAGRVFDERAFIARHRLEAGQAAQGPYFRPLGKLEVLGDLLNSAAWFSAIGTAPRPLAPERAMLAARLCVELGPEDFNNYDTLAQALLYARRPVEALAALEEALSRRPPVTGSLDERYWSDRLKRFTAGAEEARGGRTPQPGPGPRERTGH